MDPILGVVNGEIFARGCLNRTFGDKITYCLASAHLPNGCVSFFLIQSISKLEPLSFQYERSSVAALEEQVSQVNRSFI